MHNAIAATNVATQSGHNTLMRQ